MATSFSLRSNRCPFFHLPSPRSQPLSCRLSPLSSASRFLDLRVTVGCKRRRNRVVARLQLEDSEEVSEGELKGGDQKREGDLGLSSGSVDGGFNWREMPMRYKLIGTTSLAFVICNMDKVNLSIAIIPMSHQFGWNSSTAGLVQSSFFWGYAMSQLPGGWLAKLFGGRKVLKVGVLAWSLATILVPFVAGFMPGLVLSRILVYFINCSGKCILQSGQFL